MYTTGVCPLLFSLLPLEEDRPWYSFHLDIYKRFPENRVGKLMERDFFGRSILPSCRRYVFAFLRRTKASAKRERNARHARQGKCLPLLARFALDFAGLENAKKNRSCSSCLDEKSPMVPNSEPKQY